MQTLARTSTKTLLFLLASGLLVACSAPEETEATAGGDAPAYNTTLDVAEIMTLVLEPASDILWDSGGWVLDASGYEELYPTTDEGWDFVRAQAAVIVESGNMLALPGRAEDNDAWMIYSEGLSAAVYWRWRRPPLRMKKTSSRLAHSCTVSAQPVIRPITPTSSIASTMKKTRNP